MQIALQADRVIAIEDGRIVRALSDHAPRAIRPRSVGAFTSDRRRTAALMPSEPMNRTRFAGVPPHAASAAPTMKMAAKLTRKQLHRLPVDGPFFAGLHGPAMLKNLAMGASIPDLGRLVFIVSDSQQF